VKSAPDAAVQDWTPILSEAEMDFVFGKIEPLPRAEIPTAARTLFALSERISGLAWTVCEFPKISELIGVLGLACVLQEDPEQLEFIEWLSTSLEDRLAVNEQRGDLRPVRTFAASVPRNFNNAAWLKEIERARSEHQS